MEGMWISGLSVPGRVAAVSDGGDLTQGREAEMRESDVRRRDPQDHRLLCNVLEIGFP